MPTPIIEHRSYRELEIRSEVKPGTIGTLYGYAAVFESKSQDFGGWREVIRKGSFTRSLKDLPDVRALYQHNPAAVLGRVGAKTLTLREDEHGLAIEIDLIDTQENRDVCASSKTSTSTRCPSSRGLRTKRPKSQPATTRISRSSAP